MITIIQAQPGTRALVRTGRTVGGVVEVTPMIVIAWEVYVEEDDDETFMSEVRPIGLGGRMANYTRIVDVDGKEVR